MVDPSAPSPPLARPYCPGCEPDVDPLREILDTRWCLTHAPSSRGLDDGSLPAEAGLSGTLEAGGEDNRRWCDLLHRSSTRSRAAHGAHRTG